MKCKLNGKLKGNLIMGIFDKIKKKSNCIKIEDIIAKRYDQKYFDECKFIWANYVPKSGQAQNLQGELLREIEKLRCEAQDNGNINWDEDHSYFCDFISESLLKQSIFSIEEKEEIALIMSYIKECGTYAEKYISGKISEESVDPNKIAYTEDNIYDIICDKIGRLQKENSEPIPYEKNNNIRR